MQTTKDLFNSLALPVRDAVYMYGGGYRSIGENEPFFPSMEKAKEFAKTTDKGGGYIVGLIAVFTFPNGERIGLTTTANFERGHQQTDAYVKAHKEANASGIMTKVWEVGYLPTA